VVRVQVALWDIARGRAGGQRRSEAPRQRATSARYQREAGSAPTGGAGATTSSRAPGATAKGEGRQGANDYGSVTPIGCGHRDSERRRALRHPTIGRERTLSAGPALTQNSSAGEAGDPM
jgi:hypothetical protein